MRISNKIAKQMIEGASILTTGGGVPLDDQLKTLKKLKKLNVPLVSLEDLPKKGYLCLAVEVGPSEAPPLKKNKVIDKMLKALIQISGKKIVGIYPPEIGQESVVLETAHYLNLPIADMDPVGRRAVPLVDISVFNLKKIKYSLSPMVICTDKGEIFTIDGDISSDRAEELLRGLTRFSSSGLLFVLAGIVSVKDLMHKKLGNLSYSKSINIGKVNSFNKLVQVLKPRLIIEGYVTKRSPLKQKGFSAFTISIKNQEGKIFKLVVFNEAIFLLDAKNSIISSVPERILLINPKTLKGLSSSSLQGKEKVIIMVTKPERLWQSKRAKKIFGKDRFNFLLKSIK